MFGEKFEIHMPQMAKNTLKLSTMVGENFEIYLPQMTKNAFKLSTKVGEISEIYLSLWKNPLTIPGFTGFTWHKQNPRTIPGFRGFPERWEPWLLTLEDWLASANSALQLLLA